MIQKECERKYDTKISESSVNELLIISNKYVEYLLRHQVIRDQHKLISDFSIRYRHLKKYGIQNYSDKKKIDRLGIRYPSGRIFYYEIEKVKLLDRAMLLVNRREKNE